MAGPTGVPSVGSTRGLAGWVHAASSRVFPGARPRPVLHSVAESGSHWIVFDVPGNASFMVPVANSAVKVISGPESRTAPVQKAICCVCAAALDAPDGRSEILISQGAKRDVHVIRHQHPGAQFIPRLPHPFPEASATTSATSRRSSHLGPVDSASRSWSNSTNLGPSQVQKSVTLATGRDPSSRQVKKYAEPGREECSSLRWKSIVDSMSVSTMENFSGGAFAPDLARTRLKPRVPGSCRTPPDCCPGRRAGTSASGFEIAHLVEIGDQTRACGAPSEPLLR